MKKNLIVSDIDGVLVDFINGLIKAVWGRFHVLINRNDIVRHKKTYELLYKLINENWYNVRYNIAYSFEEVCDFYNELINNPKFYSQLTPFYNYLNLLQCLYVKYDQLSSECNYEVCYLTNRSNDVFQCTLEFLEHWGVNFPLYSTENKCVELNNFLSTEIFEQIIVIEDCVENVVEVVDERVTLIIRQQPYNGMRSSVWSLYKENNRMIRMSEDDIVKFLYDFCKIDSKWML